MISGGNMTPSVLEYLMVESKPRIAQNIVHKIRQRYAAFLARDARPSSQVIVSRSGAKHKR